MISNQSANIRRLFLGGAVLGSVWLFSQYAITPLRQHEKDSVRRVEEVRRRLGSAHGELREIGNPEQGFEDERSALDGLIGGSALKATMVSFPEGVRQHFTRFGVPLRIIRMNTVQEIPDLPGYQRIYWSVGLAVSEADRTLAGLLISVVELEEQNRSVKVLDFALQPDVEVPGSRTVGINLVTLLPK